jgi:serine/threonine protein kinase/tetratricopeptide (TPR) repeat protein
VSFEAARWAQARELFEELLDLPPGERAERLAGLADGALRADVERLLAADSRAGGFLETPAAAAAAGLLEALLDGPSGEDAAPLPDALGPYRILSRLGRGGMGDVLLGERADGLYEARVAIKLLRRGMDSEEVLARFSRERRILARLQHAHIARLLDGGAAPDGRPYFVMELVDGEPVTSYCRSRGLSVEDRVRLLLDCCDALSIAHQNLVVHRDLKPSNVLVTHEGVVKLLDFGIAKILGPDDTGGLDVETRTELRLLTPAYAAPEQILGEPVTTATDVWSLGALAYELLTGTLPQKREGRSAARLASEVSSESLERASQRVAKSPLEALPLQNAAEADRRRLVRRLRGDLDNILQMALRREPERRYGSVTAFAGDLRRHLKGQPVKARPDTVGYRAGKFLRRNRVGAAAAALVLVSLIGGLAATRWQALRAEANARAAVAAARRADAVKEFLIGLFEIADPEQSGGSVSARDLLDQAGTRLQSELASEPDVQADLLEAVARIDRSLGRLDPAEALATRSLDVGRSAFPRGAAAIGRSLATLGAVEMSKGRLDEAEKRLLDALAILETREGRDSLAAARARSDYAQVLFWKGQVAKAEELERGVYETYRRELGEDNVQTATHLRNLGVLLEELDRLDEAERAYRSSQTVLEKRLGPDHVNLGQSYLNLAVLLDRRGRSGEAEPLYRRAYDVRRKALGASHPAVGQTLQLTALFYLNQGRLDESEAAYRQALALFGAIDPKHFEVGKCLNGLALIEARRGRYADAEATLSRVEALFAEVLGEDHPFTWQVRGNRAEQIARQGRLEEAEAIQRTVAAKLAELNGPESAEAIEAGSRLGETLRRLGRGGEAVSLHRRALEAQRRLLGDENVTVALALFQLGADLAALGGAEDRAEARRLLDQSLATLEKQSPPHQRLSEVRAARKALGG